MKIKTVLTRLGCYFFVGEELISTIALREHMRVNNKPFCFIMNAGGAGVTIAFFDTIYMLEKCTSGISKNTEKVKIMLDPADGELREIEVTE